MILPGETTEYGIYHNARIKVYPDGSREVLAASRPIFRAPGYEERRPAADKGGEPRRSASEENRADNLSRAQRRARTAVRDLALSNPMAYFITLTLSADKVDRYDMAAVMRKVNIWLDNQVRRRGLAYIIIPELHKDGAIHFHGLCNAALAVVDSGTMVPPGGGKPKRPRSAAQRAAWLDGGGRVVYNLPGWGYGFSAAMALYGDYRRAISYVCKYISKGAEKVGGRWYYHGGQLVHPSVQMADMDYGDVVNLPGAACFGVDTLGGVEFCVWRMEDRDGDGRD